MLQTPLTLDMAPPTAFTPTVKAGNTPITVGAVLTGTPQLTLTWLDGQDGSGVGMYIASWQTKGITTATRMTTYAPQAGSATLAAQEGTAVTALLYASDTLGNGVSQQVGPFYVDGPLIPDYLDEDDTAWFECHLLGTDVRIRDQAQAYAALSDAQSLYATWRA